MGQIERIGVSVERDLLAKFDKLIDSQGYENRSEAIRDLIRQQLNRKAVGDPKAKAVAAVCIVYNHHATKLMERLTSLQHSHLLETVSSMHVHLDHYNCMEVIVLKGSVGQINKVADNIISQKGVKLGQVNIVPVDELVDEHHT